MKEEISCLVFSIATNGYDEIFKDCIQSHREYATKYGYEYMLFNGSPPDGISGSDSAWMKVPLIIKALEKGYDWIAFFDSDCKLFDETPRIESVYKAGKELYMAKDGRDDIPNTGVIIIKNGKKIRRAFQKILLLSDLPLKMFPKKNWGLYEMGHIVNFTRQKKFFQVIDQRWNDTLNQYSDHFVLHAHGQYSKKSRSKEKPLTVFQSIEVRFRKGLRFLRLIRYARYYWK